MKEHGSVGQVKGKNRNNPSQPHLPRTDPKGTEGKVSEPFTDHTPDEQLHIGKGMDRRERKAK